jgi:uncharacterized protein (DUF169 family)
MNLKSIHEKSEELMNLLRLKSFPLAVKLLEDEKSIPSESKRPVKDWGYHLDLCQAFSMSRWEEKNIAMLKKDMWCFEPVVGYGLAEPPEDFLKGNNRYPFSAMSQKAGEKWATSLPKMQVGQYIGIVSASLRKCTFEPDVMMVYADPSQITQILIAKNCIDGEDISCSLSGHAACVYAVVPVMQDKKCKIVSSCRGDRRIAMAQDNEMIFSAPMAFLEDLICSLKYLKKQKWGYPWGFELKPERELDNNYAELGKKMGMDYVK